MRLLLNSLGSGIITAAADDDLSGIATYSVAGAQLGSKLLRTALLRFKSCGRNRQGDGPTPKRKFQAASSASANPHNHPRWRRSNRLLKVIQCDQTSVFATSTMIFRSPKLSQST